MNRFQEPEARRIIAELDLPPASRGLDVGCGVGLYALWLAEAVGPAGRVTALEPEVSRVDAARSLTAGQHGADRVEFRMGDGTVLPVPDQSADWLWCGDVLHHIVDTARALREFARVVKPGGRIVIKESQVLSALFLPGHPELERRIQIAEIRRTLEEGAGRSFQERRQTTVAALRAAGSPPRSCGTTCCSAARRSARPITTTSSTRCSAATGASAFAICSPLPSGGSARVSASPVLPTMSCSIPTISASIPSACSSRQSLPSRSAAPKGE